MKTKLIKSISLMAILLIAVSFMNTSCAVRLSTRSHAPKGWFKNSNNPHHPKSTNPGHNKEKKNKGKKDKHHHEASIFRLDYFMI